MVELEEVEDQELDAPQRRPSNDDEDSADFTDTGPSVHILSSQKPPIPHSSPFSISPPRIRPVPNPRRRLIPFNHLRTRHLHPVRNPLGAHPRPP